MEAPPLERRLAAILAADVEGYSRLMHGDEEATMATLSARRAVVDELIAQHRGRIANTAGDSVLAEFASVLDAVRCAIEIQAALQKANEGEPEGRRMRFRIGVNVGDVMVKDDDIFGDGVNVAARLEGLVKGGEIYVSRGVHDHLRHRGGMVFEDLGEHWSRTSRTRSGRFVSELVMLLPSKRSRPLRYPNRRPPRRRSPNCLPITKSPSSWRFGIVSRTAVLPSWNPTSSNIPKAPSLHLPEHGLMQPRFRPQIPRRRHPRRPLRKLSISLFGIP
jgi:class 3 adenylate cyclase